MRPIKLEVNNIASFFGQHSIDFGQAGGLFAITGATGAGKSTLLNSICLALYGRGPKKSLFAQDYLSQGQDSGFIIFHFSHQAKNYQAHWRIDRRTTKQDKISIAVKRLFYCDQRPMRAGAESVLGMSFEQFCRTVILNQGDFAKFINSSFSERRDIIERLAQAKELQYVHQLLSQELKAHEIELQHYRDKSQWYSDAREYDSQAAQKIILQISQVKDLAQHILSALQLSLNALERCREHTVHLSQNQQKIEQTKELLNQLLKEFLPVRESHTKSQMALHEFELDYTPKQSMLQEAIGVTTQLEALAQQQERLQKEQLQLNQRLHNSSVLLTNQQQELSELIRDSQQLQDIWNLNPDKFWNFENIQQDIFKLQALEKLITQFQQEVDVAKEELTILDHKIASIENEISLLPINVAFSEQDEVDLLKAEKKLAQKQQQHTTQLHWTNLLQDCYKNISNLIEQLPEINSKIELKGKDQTIAKRDLQVHQLQHSLKQITQLSLESGICLVCGHTTAELNHDLTPDQMGEVATNHQNLEKNLEIIEAAYNQLKSLRDSKLALVQREQERFKHGCQQLTLTFIPCPPEMLLEQHEMMFSVIKTSIQNHEELWGNLVMEEAALKQQRSQFEKDKKENIQLVTLKSQRELWQQQWQRANAEQLKKSALVSQHIAEFKLGLQELQGLKIPLPIFNEFELELNGADEKSILPRLLTEWGQWRQGATQWQQLQQKILLLKNSNSQTQQEHELLQKSVSDIKHELEKLNDRQNITRNLLQTLSPNGNPKLEWQQLQETYQKIKTQAEQDKDRLAALESKRDRFKTTLSMMAEQEQSIEQMAIHYHATFENHYSELHAKMQGLSEQIELLQIIWPNKMHDKTMPRLSQKIPELYQSSLELSDFNQTLTSFDIFISHYLTPQLSWMKTFYDFCQTEIHSLNIEYQRLSILQQEWQVMLKTMDKLQTRFNSLRDLDHIIGKNDFRNWALAKIEEELIHLANRELEQLCQGRYRLVQEIGKNGPEFLIEDLWSCALPRKVSSLSGGETFLVSLAMAMSLADMVRGQTYLESFFIDEGFGQLDSDGLDEAMAALWSIGQRGKTIGVISHIAELTDRIPVNIHVEKGTRGQAHIDMIHH